MTIIIIPIIINIGIIDIIIADVNAKELELYVDSLDVNDFASVVQISDAVESSMKADKELPNEQYNGLLLTDNKFIQNKPLEYIKKTSSLS